MCVCVCVYTHVHTNVLEATNLCKKTFVKLLQGRGSLLMFISTFLTFMTIGGFPSFVEEMKVCLHPYIYMHVDR